MFSPFYPPNNPKNQKFEKVKKIPGNIIILQMCTINNNHMMYGSWDIKRDRQIFLSFWTIFCPFKNQNFEKMKKTHGDITIWHKCTINHDHMLYCSWDMTGDRYNCYFSFWAIFCHFTPLIAQKMKISKKEKNTWRYHHFTQVPKIMIICYTVPETWYVTDVILIFHFGLFFSPFCSKFQKNEKNSWRYHFTHVYQKLWLDEVRFLRLVRNRQMDRWM